MTPILQLQKQLAATSEPPDVPGVTVRTYRGEDIPAWLAIRNQACQGLEPPVRDWTPADFRSEVLNQPWWRPARLWLAEEETAGPVGTVILAERRGSTETLPVVHWLGVLPAYRGRGIARLLMWHLEASCQQAGWREVRLETHRRWTAAVGLYRALGYDDVRSR